MLQLRRSQRWQRVLLKGAALVSTLGLMSQPAIASDQETLLLITDPLDLSLLEPGAVPTDGSVITANTISQTGPTIPSLWWAKEQFGGKLLNNWIAYPGTDGNPRRIDLLVNQQVWSLLNYLERYTFIDHFGTVARDYGYSTRIFNQQQTLLAAYICNFDQLPSAIESQTTPNEAIVVGVVASSPPACNVFLDSSGRGGLRGSNANPFSNFNP